MMYLVRLIGLNLFSVEQLCFDLAKSLFVELIFWLKLRLI